MSQSLKGYYPWLLGATSYVVPADLTTNVRLLAEKVDAVQLLFFESSCNSALEHPVNTGELKRIAAEYDLAYTVHLPTDLGLGDSDGNMRRKAIGEIDRMITDLSVLSPRCYDLHVHKPDDLAETRWLANVEQSLAALALRLGEASKLVAIENIDYPYGAIAAMVAAHGFSRCLDLGHIHRYGHGLDDALADVKQARHIHYHGVENGRDHGAILSAQQEVTMRLGEELKLAGYDGIVTLEMYSMAELDTSLQTLEAAWLDHARSKQA